MDAFYLIKVVTLLVLPPGCLLLLLAAAVLAWRRWPRLARAAVALATLGLYLASMPLVAGRLAGAMEPYPAVTPMQLGRQGVQVIVVLGGGRRAWAPEFGAPTVSAHTLERLRYAALLQRTTGLPLAVSGGSVLAAGPAEGDLMAQALVRDFHAVVRFVERRSRNTEENASLTRALLEAEGISHIALVSHATHLYRAVRMFRDQGFTVLPAPTGFMSDPAPDSPTLGDFLPSAPALDLTRLALHEWLGSIWYRARHR